MKSFLEKRSQPESTGTQRSSSGISMPAVPLKIIQPKLAGEENTVNEGGRPNTTGLPHNLKSGVENLSGIDISDVKVHYNSSRPAELQAHAYAQGTDIHVGPGQEKHLAHEAWHVVQQKQGRVRATMQMKGGVAVNDDKDLEHEADIMGAKAVQTKSFLPKKGLSFNSGSNNVSQLRGPEKKEIDSIIGVRWDYVDDKLVEDHIPDRKQHADGLRTVLKRNLSEIPPLSVIGLNQTIKSKTFNIHATVEDAIANGNEAVLSLISEEMISFSPLLKLGDPASYHASPTTSTEIANITTLVDNTNHIFDQVISTNANIVEVFGAPSADTVKGHLRSGKLWLNYLYTHKKILSDRSGTSEELNTAGLTAVGRSIFLNRNTIDNPGNPESIVTTFHESMHAGNANVVDLGYLSSPNFSRMSLAAKLNNASHYEELARRLLGANPIGGLFVPFTDVPVSGSSAPQQGQASQTDKAIKLASEKARSAWTIGINWHSRFIDVYQNKAFWSHHPGGVPFSAALPYMSKVENLTMHRRIGINDTLTDKAAQPVTQIDLALSEGLVKRLNYLMNMIPSNTGLALLLSHDYFRGKTLTEINSMTVEMEAAVYLKLILEKIGTITGSVERDLKVVDTMALIPLNSHFMARDPAGFVE